MPLFQTAATNRKGTPVYMYSLAPGESASIVAQTMLATSIGTPQFTYIEPGAPSNSGHSVNAGQLDAVLARGGKVRGAMTAQNGQTVTVQIENGQIMLIPSDGQQSTCDEALGIGGFMNSSGNTFQGSYGDNGFQGDSMGFQQPFGYGGGQMPGVDPYGGYTQQMPDYQQQGFGNGFDNGYNGMQDDQQLADPRAQQGEAPSRDDEPKPVKLGTWILTLILLAIPIVNIIFIIVTLVSKKTNPSKKSYVGAVLILWIISIVLMSASVMLFGNTITAALHNSGLIASTQTESQYDESEDIVGSSNALNESSNMNMTNTSNASTSLNTTGSDAETAVSPVSVTLDSSTILTQGDRRVIAISATLTNNSTEPVAPGNVLTINAMQGTNALAQFDQAIDGFDPNSVNIEIQPGSSSGFAVAFILGNEDPVDVSVSSIGSEEVLGTNQFPGV